MLLTTVLKESMSDRCSLTSSMGANLGLRCMLAL